MYGKKNKLKIHPKGKATLTRPVQTGFKITVQLIISVISKLFVIVIIIKPLKNLKKF